MQDSDDETICNCTCPICTQHTRRHSFPGYFTAPSPGIGVSDSEYSEAEYEDWEEDSTPAFNTELPYSEGSFAAFLWERFMAHSNIFQPPEDLSRLLLELFAEASFENPEILELVLQTLPNLDEMTEFVFELDKDPEGLSLFKIALDIHENYLLKEDSPLFRVYQNKFLPVAITFYKEYDFKLPYMLEPLQKTIDNLDLSDLINIQASAKDYEGKKKEVTQSTTGIQLQDFYL